MSDPGSSLWVENHRTGKLGAGFCDVARHLLATPSIGESLPAGGARAADWAGEWPGSSTLGFGGISGWIRLPLVVMDAEAPTEAHP